MIIKSNSTNPFIFIIGLVFMAIFLIGSFYLASWIFDILKFVTPALLIGTAILNYRVLVNYGRWLVSSFRSNLLMGLVYSLLTVIAFPFVAAWLFIKALFGFFVKKKINEMEEQQQGKYIEYEEIDSELIKDPQIEKNTRS